MECPPQPLHITFTVGNLVPLSTGLGTRLVACSLAPSIIITAIIMGKLTVGNFSGSFTALRCYGSVLWLVFALS